MKKILFIYPDMQIGGSTSALLSFLNSLSKKDYEIDIQLYKNEGPLINMLPTFVNLLPQAELYCGLKGKFIKLFLFIFTGYIYKAIFNGVFSYKKTFFSRGTLGDFKATKLSRKNNANYDYAVGYLEGWSDRYLAYMTSANFKYAWLHSTFANITTNPKEEIRWMNLVDRIVFVANDCRDDFQRRMPQMSSKAITIENLIDSKLIHDRSLMIDENNDFYFNFSTSQLFKIITVCRLDLATKGLDRIVTCADYLKSTGKEFLWYIVGEGKDGKLLKDLIRKSNLENKVILTGKIMNPYPFIALADVMCMPSRYEGKPLVVTESLILGVPPIVTEYLSANNQIRTGFDGIVVENNDTSFFNVLEQCIINKNLVLRMKDNIKGTEYGNSNFKDNSDEIFF